MKKFIFDVNPYYDDGSEDGFEYEYKDGSLNLKIFCSEGKIVSLMFHGCLYQYFSPIPGYTPFKRGGFSSGSMPDSSVVYEIENGDLLEKAKESYESISTNFSKKQFFMYLYGSNMVLDVIAKGFSYELIEIRMP
ncbi:hypothetical protein [Asaia sp. HN010]|uniref:hypothetical protein n=1 Tax=Asaia sp. HN010 TaxID=3081233 RepID=UPI0030169E93